MTAAVYKNFLTDTVLHTTTVEALQAARVPVELDGDTWKQLDVSGSGEKERDFLVGLGAAIEQPVGRWLVRSSVVDALYGPAETAMFRFNSAEEPPSEERLGRMAHFLRTHVLPPYVTRAQRLLKSVPDTVYDGVILRENLQTLQLLIRALEARFSTPSAGKAAP
jgi:hypothetical protein